MDTINIQLRGGEKDGYEERDIPVESGRPDLVFIWRTEDDEKMRKVSGDARKALADKLGVLAYRFCDTLEKPELPGGLQFLYERHPEADKKLTSA